ncbi:MAG TPA: hypothetical protein VHC22_22665 [Pirellulales bacterium]|nr:hypothetical protein [Pirellulales bacterium]
MHEPIDPFLLLRAEELHREVREAIRVHRYLMNERREIIRHARAVVADLRSTTEIVRQTTGRLA